jgi:hypothetical protein
MLVQQQEITEWMPRGNGLPSVQARGLPKCQVHGRHWTNGCPPEHRNELGDTLPFVCTKAAAAADQNKPDASGLVPLGAAQWLFCVNMAKAKRQPTTAQLANLLRANCPNVFPQNLEQSERLSAEVRHLLNCAKPSASDDLSPRTVEGVQARLHRDSTFALLDGNGTFAPSSNFCNAQETADAIGAPSISKFHTIPFVDKDWKDLQLSTSHLTGTMSMTLHIAVCHLWTLLQFIRNPDLEGARALCGDHAPGWTRDGSWWFAWFIANVDIMQSKGNPNFTRQPRPVAHAMCPAETKPITAVCLRATNRLLLAMFSIRLNPDFFVADFSRAIHNGLALVSLLEHL